MKKKQYKKSPIKLIEVEALTTVNNWSKLISIHKFYESEILCLTFIDKYICNICRQDIRACSHIQGRLYKGKICYFEPINLTIDHVALVEVPKDIRCRIWPWNKIDDSQIKMPILTQFSIDDFLRD